MSTAGGDDRGIAKTGIVASKARSFRPIPSWRLREANGVSRPTAPRACGHAQARIDGVVEQVDDQIDDHEKQGDQQR